jgi:ubiquitin C-terminal hydrolase
MFGLRNKNGSCWINAALQGIFRIPELQKRFSENQEDVNNKVEMGLAEIYGSSGDEGLRDFYECVKTATMPAGEGIGDSHELLEFVCDKVPFLDELLRFKVVHNIRCRNPACDYTDNRNDSVVEFEIAPTARKMSLMDSILESVRPFDVDDWKCERCLHNGCTKSLLLSGTFPKVLTFHVTSVNTSVTYSSQIVLNGNKYALLAVICFDGGHWNTYGRDMPPGQPWYLFNDQHVQSFDPKHFPLVDTARLLMYYRINE